MKNELYEKHGVEVSNKRSHDTCFMWSVKCKTNPEDVLRSLESIRRQ